MKISEILRDAADRYLWDGSRGGHQVFSCGAVENVLNDMTNLEDYAYAYHHTFLFLKELGVNIHSEYEFDEVPRGEIRQCARFLWLDFAALVAEDEGL